jgi:hypothetical protein
MDKAELKRLWTIRMQGLQAMWERTLQERSRSTPQERFVRTCQMFISPRESQLLGYDKEEEKVRQIWTAYHRKWQETRSAGGV